MAPAPLLLRTLSFLPGVGAIVDGCLTTKVEYFTNQSSTKTLNISPVYALQVGALGSLLSDVAQLRRHCRLAGAFSRYCLRRTLKNGT